MFTDNVYEVTICHCCAWRVICFPQVAKKICLCSFNVQVISRQWNPRTSTSSLRNCWTQGKSLVYFKYTLKIKQKLNSRRTVVHYVSVQWTNWPPHVSQQSSLLALVLVDQRSQTVGPFGHSLTDTQPMIRRCCQLFAVSFSWLSADLWNFSPPRHLGSARPARPAGWPHRQTAPGAAEEALPWPSVTLKFISGGLLTKDGVGSKERPCLENVSQIWRFVKWV